MSFRQDLPERSVQQSEINFRQAQKKRLLFRGAVFVYIPEKITRISTSCAFSAVPASAAREAVGAYQDGPADRDGHHDAAQVSAQVYQAVGAYQDGPADRGEHHDAAQVSAAASARAALRGAMAAVSGQVSAAAVSARAGSRVSMAAASARVCQADSTDSDAEAAVFQAVSDGHPDDPADSDAEAGRRVWLLQAGARLRRVQALKVSLRSSFPLN